MSARSPLDEALIGFGPNDVTVRVGQAIMGVLPGVAPLAAWRSVDDAALALHPTAPAGLAARAQQLASGKEALNALLIANALDQGDRGITIYTGLSTAMSFFFGKKAGLQADAQQRSDAAVKALALALLVHRLIPGTPEDAVWTLRALPTGAMLLRYYGAVEIDLAFVDEAIAADGKFVAGLLEAEVGGVAPRLQALAGKDGLTAARAILPALTPVLEEMATEGLAHVGTVAETVKSFLPAALGGARDALPDLVATGADSLPMYQLLVPRLIAEALLARARAELDPTWRPAPAQPTGQVAPEAAAEAPAELAAAPSADPFAAPFAAAPSLAGVAISSTETVFPEAEAPAARRIPRRAPRAAPPAPTSPKPPTRATPTLILSPEEAASEAEEEALDPGEPLSGSFVHRAGASDIWLIFTRDGRFTNHPPLKPPPIDWEAHARAGHEVGRYARRGESLVIRWDGGREDEATLVAQDDGIQLDGRPCARADWDLSGCALRGTWRPRGEDRGGYWFAADGRFAEADDERHGGTYSLGPSRIELRWDEGGVERLALLSDLDPDPEAPDVLWIAGTAFDRRP